MSNKHILLILLLLYSTSCKKEEGGSIIITPAPPPTVPIVDNSNQPNILLIVADDFGIDTSPGYLASRTLPKARMPNIEGLIQSGLVFDNFWSAPNCAPSRAALITGKYGLETKVIGANDQLDISENIIHKVLKEQGYTNALIGKWHLSGETPTPSTPNRMGVDYFAGILKGKVEDYHNWDLIQNGVTTISTEYITSKLTDLAIDWVNDQQAPWLLWLAYTAPHEPLHLPPNDLHTQGDLPTDEQAIQETPLPYYHAMAEAMDKEIGRLLASLSAGMKENTWIIFVGDNGSPEKVSQIPSKRGKGSLYQGGINVPLIVSGNKLNRKGRRTSELVNSIDLFATIADFAGSTKRTTDSRSFKALLTGDQLQSRQHLYSESIIGGTEHWAIRDVQYKLIESLDGRQEMYDLTIDPFELTDLLKSDVSEKISAQQIALSVRAQQIRLQ